MRKTTTAWATATIMVVMLSPIDKPAAETSPGLTVQIAGLDRNKRFADVAAFCPASPSSAHNISPGVSWSAGPQGTRSYALLMTDPDVPKEFNLINIPGVVIPTKAPRISVFHWVLVDIPASLNVLAPGAESEGLVAGGKPIGETAHGRRGVNVYTTFLAGKAGMAGTYGGYDGPCPPANDARIHRYVIRVFALDVRTLGLSGAFDGEAVERAIEGHVLASGEAVATYTLNPSLIQRNTE
jgi:Raf kinase inhibitor-like YbhB/YbcL family protein